MDGRNLLVMLNGFSVWAFVVKRQGGLRLPPNPVKKRRTETVIALARKTVTDGACDRMSILAGAFQDAGCDGPWCWGTAGVTLTGQGAE